MTNLDLLTYIGLALIILAVTVFVLVVFIRETDKRLPMATKLDKYAPDDSFPTIKRG